MPCGAFPGTAAGRGVAPPLPTCRERGELRAPGWSRSGARRRHPPPGGRVYLVPMSDGRPHTQRRLSCLGDHSRARPEPGASGRPRQDGDCSGALRGHPRPRSDGPGVRSAFDGDARRPLRCCDAVAVSLQCGGGAVGRSSGERAAVRGTTMDADNTAMRNDGTWRRSDARRSARVGVPRASSFTGGVAGVCTGPRRELRSISTAFRLIHGRSTRPDRCRRCRRSPMVSDGQRDRTGAQVRIAAHREREARHSDEVPGRSPRPRPNAPLARIDS